MLEVYLLGMFMCLLLWALDLLFIQKIDVFNGRDLVFALFISLFSWIAVLVLFIRLLDEVLCLLLDKAKNIIIWKRK